MRAAWDEMVKLTEYAGDARRAALRSKSNLLSPFTVLTLVAAYILVSVAVHSR